MGTPIPFAEFKRTVVAIAIGREIWVWSCDDASRPEILEDVGAKAADPACAISWMDALQIRRQIESADFLFPQ